MPPPEPDPPPLEAPAMLPPPLLAAPLVVPLPLEALLLVAWPPAVAPPLRDAADELESDRGEE